MLKTRTFFILFTLILFLFIIGNWKFGLAQTPVDTVRVSISSTGEEGNGNSFAPSVSEDGRYITFESSSNNLTEGPHRDGIFVHDVQTGQTVIITFGYDGQRVGGDSYQQKITPDGRFISYVSNSPSIVANDTNDFYDFFVHDRDLDEDGIFDEPGQVINRRVSVASDGTQGIPGTSVFVMGGDISANGRYVVFNSDFPNLVSGDANGVDDIFVHDLLTGETRMISIASDGTQGDWYSIQPTISGDGRFVVFASEAGNLDINDANNNCDTDNDGIYEDSCIDIFLHDRDLDEDDIFDEPGQIQTTMISVAADGTQGSYFSWFPDISEDGRFVVFHSSSPDLFPGDLNSRTDVFLKDLLTGNLTLISVSALGVQCNEACVKPAISPDGRFITYNSSSDTLVDGDFNGMQDIFVFDQFLGLTVRASLTYQGNESNGASYAADVSNDGQFIVFESEADNLVIGDTNEDYDIFRHEMATMTNQIYLPILPKMALEE